MDMALSTELVEFSKICPVMTDDGVQWVDARQVHEALRVKRKFADWIRARIATYGFIEKNDFFLNQGKSQNGIGRPLVEYKITLNMAKELAMIENNERGKMARLYFLACEQALWASFRQRSNALAIENENLKRESTFYAQLSTAYAKSSEAHRQERARISSSREAKAISEIGKLRRENAKLKDALGIGEDWMRVAAIPWLLDFFVDSNAMRSMVGHELTNLSKKMEIPIKFIGEPPTGPRRIYNKVVVDAFKFKLVWDVDYMRKFRK